MMNLKMMGLSLKMVALCVGSQNCSISVCLSVVVELTVVVYLVLVGF